MEKIKIPKPVLSVVQKLQNSGFDAYVVGGCVRDLLLGKKPKDWDVTTNAKPEEIKKVFLKSFYENKFYTVTAQTSDKDPSLKEVEITTYRSEAKYTDKRHPDEVKPAKTLREDLSRRDLTINAVALKLGFSGKKPSFEITDPFGGQEDIKNKIIRAVGDPEQRFTEDALRLVRAVRFAATLGFKIEPKTKEAIIKNADLLGDISKERIRDEFLKIISSENAADGIDLLRETGPLKHIAPELLEGYGVGQNKHHIYEIYEHNLRSLDAAAKKGFSPDVRIAALLHDIAKPRTKRGQGSDATFYDHQIVSAKMAKEILSRLKFSNEQIQKISSLVKHHMFYYNVGEVTESSVRRLIRAVGRDLMKNLLELRVADRIGSGVPKAEPYKLRHLKYVIERVGRDPISVRMLKVNGDDIMRQLDIPPSQKIGHILDVLLGYVLNDPKKNATLWLKKEIATLGKLNEAELKSLAEGARKEREGLETKQDQMTKAKYWVT